MKTKHTVRSEQLQIKSYDRRYRGKIDISNTHVNDLSSLTHMWLTSHL